ncbi:hypothetical protein GCM10010172_54550 [Paractinoplanes ferrugineus]|uniref:Uncharacterized protein n=1 Tax=Paractinoplanes ferrugineus TaxID=113564 RepID=A0A919J1G3_9ACTN|nr:hypothetical protein Afe05nite_35670 [Actinoplanes ferrugineus]
MRPCRSDRHREESDEGQGAAARGWRFPADLNHRNVGVWGVAPQGKCEEARSALSADTGLPPPSG